MTVTTLNGLSNAVVITTPNSTMNVGTSGQDVTIDINLGNANSWTAKQTNIAVEFSQTSTPTPATNNYVMWNSSSSGLLEFRPQASSAGYLWQDSSANTLLEILTSTKAVTTNNNTLDDGSGNITINGIANFNKTGAVQVSVWNGSNAGTIVGDPSTANGSGQLYLASSEAASIGNNCGLLSIGGNSGQWEQGPNNGTSTNFMSIALNASTTACESILLNTPSGVPIQTGRYGVGTANTLDDGSGNMAALGFVQVGNAGTSAAHLYSGSGAPSISATKGDIYFRIDTPSTANQRIYICTANGNNWAGIV